MHTLTHRIHKRTRNGQAVLALLFHALLLADLFKRILPGLFLFLLFFFRRPASNKQGDDANSNTDVVCDIFHNDNLKTVLNTFLKGGENYLKIKSKTWP
jgi:hypothetical protein